MNPLLINLESDPQQAQAIAHAMQAELGELEQRHFPDGESYLRVLNDCNKRDVVIFCNWPAPMKRPCACCS